MGLSKPNAGTELSRQIFDINKLLNRLGNNMTKAVNSHNLPKFAELYNKARIARIMQANLLARRQQGQ
jgi:hypothetical protein